jgi:cyclophilin family peptidyl-prolyl cis-trans isomerase
MTYLRLVKIGIVAAVLMMTPCQANDFEMVQKKMMDPLNPVVKMDTSYGTLYIELYKKEAPITVLNVIDYIDSGYYTETIFHRVIKGFMIQGGGFEAGMVKKNTLAPIKNEATNGLKNKRGTLAMARTNVVDSATSQFFINLEDNSFLDHKGKASYGYAVFGNVIHGLNVIDIISDVKTTRIANYTDVPKEDVVIINVTLIQK